MDKDNEEDITTVTLKMKSSIVNLINKERAKFRAPRTTWITQAVIEKLESLGYEID